MEAYLFQTNKTPEQEARLTVARIMDALNGGMKTLFIEGEKNSVTRAPKSNALYGTLNPMTMAMFEEMKNENGLCGNKSKSKNKKNKNKSRRGRNKTDFREESAVIAVKGTVNAFDQGQLDPGSLSAFYAKKNRGRVRLNDFEYK